MPAKAPAAAAVARVPTKAHGHARATVCRNCATPVSGNYCPNCGQETSLHPLSVWEFVHELVSHYVAAEGKLWRTLAQLALHPGRLTVEYLAGRRQRYIVPLRLYLTASFLFFALAQFTGHMTEPDVHLRVDTRSAVAPPAGTAGKSPEQAPAGAGSGGTVLLVGPPDRETLEAIAAENFESCLVPANTCGTVKRLIAPALVKLRQDPEGVTARFGERFRHSLSYAMFLLLPIFALMLAATYRNRGLYYGEHLVFALHVHSFWFFLALLTFVLPELLANWLPLAFVAYGYWALQRVYGGRWWATTLRAVTILTAYIIVMGVGAAALSMALLASV